MVILPITAQLENNETIRAALAQPVSFARGILRDDPWDIQREILAAVAQHPRVAVKACHNSSKTFLAAEALLWWITHFSDGIVVSTAPTDRQVEKLLWGEVHKALARSVFPYPPANLTELRLGLGNYAIGFSTDKRDHGVRFQGFHSPNLLIIVDEAPGINADVWQAMEGIRAGGNVHVLALGNPTMAGGPFHDAFTANRDGWCTFTIDAFDTPNFGRLKRLAGGSKDRPVASAPAVEAAMLELLRTLPAEHNAITYSSRPYLISVQWARERLREWGERSPLWQSRVRGQFPAQAEDALISLAWIEAARQRGESAWTGSSDRIHFGCDIARYGADDSVVVVRQGRRVLAVQSWHGNNLMETTGRIVALATQYRPEEINVDDAGVGGGVTDRLEELNQPVQGVNVGQAPRNTEKFANLRAELAFGLAGRFRDNDIDIPADDALISQLATLRYEVDSRGRIKLESKDDMAKRGVKSPDRADALMLAYANRLSGIEIYYRDRAEALAKVGGNPALLPQGDNELQRIYEDTQRAIREGRSPWGDDPPRAQKPNGLGIGISSDSGWTPPGFKR